MARNFHFSRLLDYISASAIAATANSTQMKSIYRDFDTAKLDGKRLRELIDANTPTFYVLDFNVTINEISKVFDYSLFSGNEDYLKDSGLTSATLHKKLQENLRKYFISVPSAPTGFSRKKPTALSSKDFIPVYNNLKLDYDNAVNLLSKRNTYAGYRNITNRLAANIRTKLKSYSVFIAADGNLLVNNLGTSLVIIGPTFNAVREKVNEILNYCISLVVFNEFQGVETKKFQDARNQGFQIGNIINIGHTAATSGKDLIGANIPQVQEKQFLLGDTASANKLEETISEVYLEHNLQVDFNQNYSKNASILLDMNFSFTVTMGRAFNTGKLKDQEVAAVKKFIGNTILPTVVEQAKKKFFGGMVTESSASPTIPEYIAGSIADIIEGKKPRTVIKRNTAKTSGKTIKMPVISKTAKLPNLKVKTKSGTSLSIAKPPTQVTTASLGSLESLLKNRLYPQIVKNMGTGNSRNVLNFRTGRFAHSAKVERLSQSREGMISVFYSYMRNPYGTFSEGGRQEFPRTRDPKALISKSIREIGASAAYNRMRAVLV